MKSNLKINKNFFLLFFLVSTLLACSNTEEVQNEETEKEHRIVSLSGAITESLYHMEYGGKIVGVDVTSTYPTEVNTKGKLGHLSNLNTEGVLSLNPTVIMADASQKDNESIQVLTKAGIDMLFIETDYTLDNAINICKAINQKFGKDELHQLDELVAQIELSKKALAKIRLDKDISPKVMFIYSRGPGQMMIAGENTSAQSMIELVGAENAASGFESFQAYSTEGLVKANPDILLLFESGLKSLGGIEEFLKIPGITKTSAGKNKKIIAMDGAYLLGFTPRSHKAALELAQNIYK